MKILVMAEVVEEHETMVLVKLDNGFGNDSAHVRREKIVGIGSPIEDEAKTRLELCLALEAAEHALVVRQGLVMDFEKDAPTGPNECRMYDKEVLAQIDKALKAVGKRKP